MESFGGISVMSKVEKLKTEIQKRIDKKLQLGQPADLHTMMKLLNKMTKAELDELENFRFQRICSAETRRRLQNAYKKLEEKGFDTTDICRLIFWDIWSEPRRIRLYLEPIKKQKSGDKVASK